ncbi:MAG: S8 family serine peptidase [Phycisphaerae bacterium]|jgi:subtilisin family serine protease
MRKYAVLLAIAALGMSAGLAQNQHGWTQLSLSTCGVDAFLAAHPNSDGRGVVIAVMDTGVDPSIPGLTHTPDGEVKVIDVQDFTGDGDVDLLRILLDEQSGMLIKHDNDGTPIEYTPPALPAAAEERRWWFGEFKESKFVNADQPDLNDNGTTDDVFPVLVTALAGDGDDQAVCYVDTNLDRSFADEKALHNYKLAYETFTLYREQPEVQIVPMAFAANIFLRQAKVTFHFDNGAHGTHVAGIAAGYRINNQDGLNGVAPGAKVISLKIGRGALGGISVTESKRKALAYAARFAREHNVPVVCNLSYGVDSEIEGNSDIDEVVDEALYANPYLVFCTSAGNAGPGLSTVGTPAAASAAISVAAMMAADSGRDVAGWHLDEPVITLFSSRGGELDKPDVAVPGWSTSTVPRWTRHGDFWAGTSMASPYCAGLCALLISNAMQTDPAVHVRSFDVRRALWLAGRPVKGTTFLDSGWGLPEVSKAAEVLAKLLPAAKDDPVIGYEISTPCPHGYEGEAPAAYWRSTYFPSDDRQAFTIAPIFAPTTDMATRTDFTRQYTLRSNTPWCRVAQETVYLHSEQVARVFVEYDAAQLTEPGLHVGTVDGLVDGLPAFRLVNTVIVPYRFNEGNNFTQTFTKRTVAGWLPDRYFVAVPPGASSMRLVLTAPEGAKSRAGMDRIFDPYGRQFRSGAQRLDTENGKREATWTFTDDLTPGVWEVPVVSNRPDESWPYELKVQFFGIHAAPPILTEGNPERPAGDLTVTNMFERRIAASGDGQIEGFRMQKDAEFKGLKDELTYSVSLDERFNRLRLHLELAPEDYATVTDIGVLVKDGDEAIYQSAFDGHVFDGIVSTRGKKSLQVVIHAGFAIADDQRKTPVTVQIDRLFGAPVAVEVTQGGEDALNLVPSVPLHLSFEAASKLKDIPDGTRPVGYVRLRERSSQDEVLRIPIDIGG